MKLTRYLYTGPHSGAQLRVGAELLDVQLTSGQSVQLPAEHDYTQVLLSLQHLQPLDQAPASAASKAPAATKKEARP